jgi:hypothetical protein
MRRRWTVPGEVDPSTLCQVYYDQTRFEVFESMI